MKTKPMQNATGAAGRSSLPLRGDYREDDFEYWPRPTELQLAQLAARLARTEKIEPKQLVTEAWALYWESCRQIQADHKEVKRRLEAQEAKDDEAGVEVAGGLPQPDKFPVSFQQMERLLLPKLKGRTGERASVFREYALAQIISGSFTFRGGFRVLSCWDFQPEALAELREKFGNMVAERFGSWRKSIFEADAYSKFAGPFLEWYCRWTERKNSEAKSANAKKGWARRREKNKVKTGARPPTKALREILDGPSPKKSPPGA